MSNVKEFPQHSRHYDEAGVWIAKMDSELTPAETREFQEWMATDPMNEEVLLKMAKLWDKFSIMSRLSQIVPDLHKQQTDRSWRMLTIPASVILASIIGFAVLYDRIEDDVSGAMTPDIPAATSDPNVYETSVGQRLAVTLSDGSEVELNTNSRVKIDYTDEYRLVHLERGEILVDVFPDESRLLSVISGDRIIQAVGTAFSVHSTADGKLELIVIEGTVLAAYIDPQTIISSNTLMARAAQPLLAVTGGQEVVLGSSNEEVRSVSVEEIGVLLSWREGNLVFTDESLEKALAEISRYSPVEFEIVDEELKKIQIAGRFRAGDVDKLLTTLEVSFKVGHQQDKDGKVLLSHL